ncbi:MAG: putative PEP-binding protein, partial [Erythrobacter sp.]
VDVGVCGEMGGRRLEALALLGIGFRRLSITPAAVGPIKELVRKIDLAELSEALSGWLADPATDIRAELSAWADEREIETD